MQLSLTNISYAYPDAAAAVLRDVNAVFPEGWTGIIGDNGCGKTTLALIAARSICPDTGSVGPTLFSVYCQQDSTEVPPELFDLASDWGQEGRKVRELLHIEDDWFWRYRTLSGGQQKRIQIACALYQRPDVLVMDEPTNDLDAETRLLVKDALASFRGIGILISHDRDLLDSLVTRSLVFDGTGVSMRPGGYTKVSEQVASERASAIKERSDIKREVKRITDEAQRRSEEASRQKRKRSRSGLDKKDSDARERIGRAIVSGKDGVAGKLSSTMNRRVDKAAARLSESAVTKRYDHRIGGYGVAVKADFVAHLESGVISAGDFAIHVPELWVAPTDHVVMTGKNGTGKSLITRAIIGSVPESIRCAYVPQEVGQTQRDRAIASLRQYDQDQKGRILSMVARLNSDPDRLLDGSELSPGELRKLLLAEQLLQDPGFLVLDEPTNHLDVGSIEALQNMIVDFPGAVLLVSHDPALVDAVSQICWKTVEDGAAWRLKID